MTLLHHIDRLRGVDERIWRAAIEWSAEGPFPLTVAEDGGVRRDAARQAALFLGGRSKARTLEETPHGRGGAADFYPLKANGELILDDKHPLWWRMGSWFEARGLEWGGRWKGFVDRPHIQIASWRELPFPPTEEPPTNVA